LIDLLGPQIKIIINQFKNFGPKLKAILN